MRTHRNVRGASPAKPTAGFPGSLPLGIAVPVLHPVRAVVLPAVFPEQANHGSGRRPDGGLNKMITTQNPEVKNQINRRLSRIEGQLRGVQKMIDEDRDCRDIVQQLVAIRSAVQAASLSFMEDIASDCLMNPDTVDDPTAQRALMSDLIKLMGKVS